MEWKRKNRILFTVLVLFFCIQVLFCITEIKSYAKSADTVTVTIAVEKFTIGQGYLIEPEQVTVEKGYNCAQLLDQVLKKYGYTYSANGSVTSGFYLSSIDKADSGKLNIPSCIQKMESYNGINPPTNSSKNKEYPTLGEFDYNTMAGWMYSVNGDYPNVGLSSRTLNDGDVVRVQFTVYGYGADLGAPSPDSTIKLLDIADKDKLTAKIAAINTDKTNWFTIEGCEKAYNTAITALTTLDASQTKVDSALAALPSQNYIFAKSIAMNKSSLSLAINASTYQLSVSYTPTTATAKDLTWKSSNKSVAIVDNYGKVTPVAKGSTVITATTINGKSASCTITVKEIPLTGIQLNYSTLSLEPDSKNQLKVTTYTPSDTTDVKTITWSSSNPSVAEVDSQGNITSHVKGNAVITASTVRQGVLAKCNIAVVSAQELAQELTTRINDLPQASAVILSDCSNIQEVYKDYQNLSKEALVYLSSSVVSKLKACEKRAEELLDYKAKADTVVSAIAKLSGVSQLTLNNEAKVLVAQKTYNALNSEAKAMVNTSSYEKLQICINQLSVLHAQVESTEKLIKNLGNGKIALKNYSVYETAMTSYQGLPSVSKTYVSNKKILTTATNSLKQIILKYVAAMKKADASKTMTTSSVVKNFNTAYSYYQKMIKLESASFTSAEKKIVKNASDNLPIALNGIAVKEVRVAPGKSTKIKVSSVPDKATYAYTLTYKSSNTKVAKVNKSGKITGVKDGKTTIIVTAHLKADTSKTYKTSCTVRVIKGANTLPMSVNSMISKTRNYILKVDKNPDSSSQWNVIGLIRSGITVPKSYYNTFYKNTVAELKSKKGVLTASKYSEYSKLIISMTAIGKDARDIAGYNLLSYLADFDNVCKQGFNGPIWALIALDSNPEYEIPKVSGVSKQTTRKVLIDYLVAGEVKGGGWTLMGSKADVDMTGMTIQALAPYYGKSGYEKVTKAVDRALTYLSKAQIGSSGGYATYNAENLESDVQVIVALCSLGINPKTDSRFLKTGYWTVGALMEYYVKGGGFMHVKKGAANNGGAEGGVVDGMATEQGLYALAAYTRYTKGKTSLYDMSDLTVKAGEDVSGKVNTPSTGDTGNNSNNDNNSNGGSGNGNTGNGNINNGNTGVGNGSNGNVGIEGTGNGSIGTGNTGVSNGGTGTVTESSANESTTTASTTEESTATPTQESTQANNESVQAESTGWSFSGGEYTPSQQDNMNAGNEVENTTLQKQNKYQMAAIIGGVIAAVVVIVGACLLIKRKKSLKKAVNLDGEEESGDTKDN